MHADFPVSIDLEITPPKGMPMEIGGKKGKPMYPSLYVSGAGGIENLPREGWALIHFKRRSLTMGERDDESCCSADLEIHEIRLPENDSGEEMGDMADAMKKMAKDKGIDTGDDYSDEDEESEDESLASGMGESEDDSDEEE